VFVISAQVTSLPAAAKTRRMRRCSRFRAISASRFPPT
jgi:hypothetical protein